MMENKRKHFLIVDDHVLIRISLELIIKELFFGSKVFQANNLEDAKNILGTEAIDFLIVDISLPEGNSIGFVSSTASEYPKVKMLVYSAHGEDFYALSYLRAGACGFLSKQSNEEEIRKAVTNLVIKGKHITANLQEKITEAFLHKQSAIEPIEELSTREMQVARLLIEGQGNLEIASILNVKQSTISTIKSRVFQKLEITSLPELIEVFKFY